MQNGAIDRFPVNDELSFRFAVKRGYNSIDIERHLLDDCQWTRCLWRLLAMQGDSQWTIRQPGNAC